MGLFGRFKKEKKKAMNYDEIDSNEKGKVNGYSCTPEYKGRSFIPSTIQISASYNGNGVFQEKIEIW